MEPADDVARNPRDEDSVQNLGQPLTVARDSSTFRFLELPPEIRNIILEFALVVEDTYDRVHTIAAQLEKRPRNAAVAPWAPPLLSICRQVRDEGSHVFYGHNRFDFVDDRRSVRTELESKCENVGDKTWAENLSASAHLEGSLSLIQHLTYFRRERAVFSRSKRFHLSLGFLGRGGNIGTKREKLATRVGDDNLDWNNEAAVDLAFLEALIRIWRAQEAIHGFSVHFFTFYEGPGRAVLRVMKDMKRRCPIAMAWVEIRPIWWV